MTIQKASNQIKKRSHQAAAIAHAKAFEHCFSYADYTSPICVYLQVAWGEWLNLAQIRSIQYEEPPLLVMVIWANGDRSFYRQEQALALLEA